MGTQEAPLLLLQFGGKGAPNLNEPPFFTSFPEAPVASSWWSNDKQHSDFNKCLGGGGYCQGSVQSWSVRSPVFERWTHNHQYEITLKVQDRFWYLYLPYAGHRLQDFFKNMTDCKWCTFKHTIPVEASGLSNMLFSDGSRLMLEGLQQQTCNETEENVCSERPALAVPRLQTSFLLNTPLQPSSTNTHTHTQPLERIQGLFRGLWWRAQL